MRMKDYVVISDCSNKTLDGIQKDFLKTFNVDLKNPKYIKAKDLGIEEVWRMIVEDCFGEGEPKTCWDWIDEFDHTVDRIGSRCTGASYGFESLVGEHDWREALEKMIQDLVELPSHYEIYNADVWVDALFTILYLNSKDNPVSEQDRIKLNSGIDYMKAENEDDESEDDDDESEDEDDKSENEDEKPEDDDKGASESDQIKKVRKQYTIPFELDEIDTYFCWPIISTLYGGKKNILKTYDLPFEQDSRGFKMDRSHNNMKISLNKEIDIIYPLQREIYLTRWSYKKIKELETTPEFKTEDIILCHKLFKDILAENVVDELEYYDVSLAKFRPYLYTIISLKPISWQLLMSGVIIRIMAENAKTEQSDLDLYTELNLYYFWPFYTFWFSEIDMINEREQLLAKGLVYIYYNYNFEYTDTCYDGFTQISINAENSLKLLNAKDNEISEEMENDIERIKKENAADPRHQPRSKKEEKPVEFSIWTKEEKGINWDYVFLQMEMIRLLAAEIELTPMNEVKELPLPPESKLEKIGMNLIKDAKEKKKRS